MIPQRVKLQGFLCYQGEQEIRFDGVSLWILSGLNGSGKSSVFDAVTYALFGYHRGGSLHASELINKDSDGLTVEFDFLLDGHLYRAKRTLRRKAQGGATATQQILRRPTGQTGWLPVEGTGQKKEFDAWVRDHIGLTYETFTSSVLLLQGKAEKLLDSTAKGRFEVLASIVDLERYERLHRRADEMRKEYDLEKETLVNALTAVPEVDDAEWAALEERLIVAEDARKQADLEVERLHALEFQARRWAEHQGRLAAAHQRWAQAQELLADAGTIERELRRLRELRDVLPRVQNAIEQRNATHTAEEKIKQLTVLRKKLDGQLEQLDHALEQGRQKRAALQAMIVADEKNQREVADQFLLVAEQLTRVQEYDRQEADLSRILADLARFPANPAAAVKEARDLCDHLAALVPAVHVLGRVRVGRDELRRSLADEQAARLALLEITQRGEQLAATAKALRPEVEEAARARQKADDDTAAARTLLQQAQRALQDLSQLDGAPTCRACGQPLTAAHFEEERSRRQHEMQVCTVRLQETGDAQQAARQLERQLGERLARADKECQEAREEYRDRRNRADQCRKDIERLVHELNQAYHEVPVPFRERVSPALPADWLATTYPTAEEVETAQREASGLTTARRQLRDAEDVHQQWNTLKAQEASFRQNLVRLQAELPADRQAVRQQHSRLESERQALDKTLTAHRAESLDVQKELDRLTRERERLQQHLADVNAKVQAEETARNHCQQTLARIVREVPPVWRTPAEQAGTAEHFVWQGELNDLVRRGAEERGQRLEQARQGLELLRQDVEALERAGAEFAPEARQEPAAVQAALAQAKQDRAARDDELGRVRQTRGLMERNRTERARLEAEKLHAESEWNYATTLAKLLSRDRLQMHLVRQAERQVVDHANAVLDRLSAGQLYLRLRGAADGDDTTAKALELEVVNRTTGERPINVMFLSGSQKFRVAVSLALGLGQYASRQHRPIESVIIDEGFGCLDRVGRQVMIQELQNLRGHLHCVLLVSHQEEFAEAFTDGYHFELADGATKVTRVQR